MKSNHMLRLARPFGIAARARTSIPLKVSHGNTPDVSWRRLSMSLLVIFAGGQAPFTRSAGTESDELLAHVDAGNIRKVLEAVLNHDGTGQVNEKGTNGWTPLLLAAVQGRTDIVQALLHAGADADLRFNGEETPLMLAAAQDHIAVVRLLVEARSNIDARCTNDRTALMLAAANGHEDTVEALIALRADVGARDSKGERALDYAARYGHRPTVAVLLQNGAELEAGNDLSGMRWGNINHGKQQL